MPKRLVVVGGVAGGTSAAAKAKRTNREWDIHIFEKGPYVSYGGCGLPYFVAGEIPRKENLIVRWPHQFEEQGIHVSVNSEVKAIDTSKGEVEVLERYGLLRIKKSGGIAKTKAGTILKNAYKTLIEVKEVSRNE